MREKLKELRAMRRNYPQRTIAFLSSLLVFGALTVQAQSSGSTRPRRATRQSARTEKTETTTNKSSSSLLDVEPVNVNANNSGGNRRRSTTPATNSDAPLRNPIASTPVGAPVAANNSSGTTADTSHAFSLLKEKQYEAALKEARQITDNNPNDSEGWKIAGFAELNLKQYEAASTDLQKAFDLQRTARQEDPFTSDALAHAYFLSDKFDRALPLLVAATTRKDAKPETLTVYY